MLSAGFFLFGFCTWAQAQGTLTEAEQNWLDQHNGKIVLGHDPAANPIEFIDKDGKFRGLAADYVRLLEEKLSFKFKIAKIPTWEGVVEQAKERKVDVLCAFTKNPQREKWLLFTDPYLIIPAVIITRNEMKGDLSLVKMTGKKVTFTKGWVIEDYLRKNFDNLVLIPAVNGMAAMDAVSTGQADAWVTALTTASVLIDKFKVTNLRVGGEVNFSFKLAMASRNDWPILNRILIKGFSLITPNEKSKILNKWISLRQRSIFENEDFWLNLLLICAVVLGIFGAVVVWNISLRRQVARRTVELEKSRKQLAALFRKSPLWITLSTLEEGVYIDVNDTFTQMTGYRREEVLGRTSIEMNIWDDPGERLRAVETAREQGRLHNFHIDYRSKDGSLHNALWSAETIELDGKLCLISVLRDITERKIAEKTLAQNQETLDATGRMAKVGGWELDAKTLGIKWTDETYRIHEIPIGSQPSLEEAANFFHPDDQEKLSIALNRSLELGEPYDMVVRFITAKGRQLWTHTIFKPILENGKVIRLTGTFQDITKLKQAEEALALSERKYRELVENLNDAIYSVDLDGTISYVSATIEQILGYGPQELIGSKFTERIHTDDREVIEAAFQEVVNGELHPREYRMIAKNGELRWVRTSSRPVFVDGNVVGLQGTLSDITEQKHFEFDSREATLRQREAVRAANVGLWDWDLTTDKVRYSPEWKLQIGYKEHEISDEFEEWRSRVHPDDLQSTIKRVQQSIKDVSKDHHAEFRFRHKNGSYIWVMTHGSIITDENGKPIRMLGSHVDISERKKYEHELRRRVDFEQTILHISSEMAGVSGEMFDQAINHALAVVGEFTKSDRAYLFEFSEKPDLARNTYEWCAEGVESQINNLQKVNLPEELPYFFKRIMNLETFMINDVSSLPLEGELDRQHFQSQGIKSLIVVPMETAGKLVGFLGFDSVTHYQKWDSKDEVLLKYFVETLNNIIERRRAEISRDEAESRLRQAQKMEAVGTLAGGIAHDFNNILAAIMGYAEIALDDIKEGKTNAREIESILEASNRAKRLVQRILTFSRRSDPEFKVLELNKEVVSASNLLQQTIPKMIKIRLDLSNKLDPVLGDPFQIEQILMNLATNARDAMPNGGTLSITTSQEAVKNQRCAICTELFSGNYEIITVTDTGEGMDQDTLSKIFDPFFTTKEVDKGTGLGLSTVFGVVNSHNGHITCSSEPGQGTTFRIYLPPTRSKRKGDGGDDLTGAIEGGRETILFVDDERNILDIGSRQLTGMGYRTITASNGEEALEIFKAKGDEIDLVILDLSMPGMGGHKCLQGLLSIAPNQKVIVATGYSRDGDIKETLSIGISALLFKPITKAELLKTVRMVLDT
ncbi:MAG: PAS domain S-box protein [Desulfarculaceae bacterium]|nr:PAS domain S-box protein [Desulfarculaceae bacterium]MCF8103583.1 PAS domain S-box protein [Desulfarculaceae bacterium]MCF8118373.1 PAS domain S-box protein [Desulfarculaceae bacterium]